MDSNLTSVRRERLRRIFLQKGRAYSPPEAAQVLSITEKDVIGMIEGHSVEAEAETVVTYSLPWRAVARLALEDSSVAELIEALGDDASTIVPPLLFPSPEPLHVTLPLYAAKLLEYLAARGNTSVDESLAEILHEYAEELVMPTPAEVEDAIPGLDAALAFPDEPEELA